MTNEQQVCLPKTAKRLKELGVKQESSFVHIKTKHTKGTYYVTDAIKPLLLMADTEWYAAFTSAELGFLFKSQISKAFELCVDYEHTVWQDNEIEARAEIIIRGIESGLLSV